MSSRRMTRSRQGLFGRAVCVLGLLLVSQLAYAGQLCFSVLGLAQSLDAGRARYAHAPLDTSGLQAATAECCQAANLQPDPCIVSTPRIHGGALAAASASANTTLAGAEAPYYAGRTSFPALQQRSPAGLAPGFPPPLHILFGRYLS